MIMKEIRARFDRWFDHSHPLRRLAVDIAGMPASRAAPFICTCSQHHPFNFLANGVTGSSYDLPIKDKDHKTALAVWKLASSEGNAALHGFVEADQPLKGLSLLFDPVVDFSLASHMFRNGVLPTNPIVMVLTDYYPIDQRDIIRTIERCWSPIPKDSDWGALETVSYNDPGYWTGAMKYLKWALLNVTAKTPPRPSQNVPANPALELIVENDLLLWNFLPMFRGGTKAVGIEGLPTGDGYKLICIDWMMRFVEAVNASVVLLCFNQKLGMQLSRAGTVSDYSVPNPPASWYGPDIGVLTKRLDLVFASTSSCIRECYRLTHPGAWIRDDEPIREMVRNIIRRHIQEKK
jgi:hypothetical protein